MMYDELVKELRIYANDETDEMRFKAADSIEELVGKTDTFKWISVTERLPEKAGKYLVCGRWRGEATGIWVCEFMTLGCLKGWTNNAANPLVSHWMELPPAPKAEEATP